MQTAFPPPAPTATVRPPPLLAAGRPGWDNATAPHQVPPMSRDNTDLLTGFSFALNLLESLDVRVDHAAVLARLAELAADGDSLFGDEDEDVTQAEAGQGRAVTAEERAAIESFHSRRVELDAANREVAARLLTAMGR